MVTGPSHDHMSVVGQLVKVWKVQLVLSDETDSATLCDYTTPNAHFEECL